MKKTIATLLLSASLAVSLTTGASAQFAGPSKSGHLTTVEQTHAARRGQDVTLTGFVSKHIRDRYYLFHDATGEIRVRIDRHQWRGRTVTTKTRLRLTGRIDRDFLELYVNVGHVEILD